MCPSHHFGMMVSRILTPIPIRTYTEESGQQKTDRLLDSLPLPCSPTGQNMKHGMFCTPPDSCYISHNSSRLHRPFAPPTVTLKEIHDAVPKHLLKRDPWKASFYVARDIVFIVLLFKFAASINTWTNSGLFFPPSSWSALAAKSVLWSAYWWFQGLVWAGVFCLGIIPILLKQDEI